MSINHPPVSAFGRKLSSIARVKAVGWFPAFPGYFGTPKTRALFEATYFAGLRKAGMPEND
jgi:hypothetical protein